MGFVQVRLEIVAIGINNIAAFVRAGPASPNIGSKHLSLSKAKQRLRADAILMPHLTQSPVVSCHSLFFARTKINPTVVNLVFIIVFFE